MLRMRCCVRCMGDLFLEDGPEGGEWVCVQCGGRSIRQRTAGRARRPGQTTGAPHNSILRSYAYRFDAAADGDLSGIRSRRRSGAEKWTSQQPAVRSGAAVALPPSLGLDR